MLLRIMKVCSAGCAAYPTVALLLLACMSANGQAAQHTFPVCTDFHCDISVEITLTPYQWQQVDTLFQRPASPKQEREQIRRAIALLERLVGGISGTWRDKARNSNLDSTKGQLDCIAESLNTTAFLREIESAGLLRWHSVEDRAMRRRWLVSDHWSAVIRDQTSGMTYAVDSWYLDNGELPYIQILQDWRDGIDPTTNSNTDKDNLN